MAALKWIARCGVFGLFRADLRNPQRGSSKVGVLFCFCLFAVFFAAFLLFCCFLLCAASERLGVGGERFIVYAQRLLKEFGTAVGAPAALVNLCARRLTMYLRGIRAGRRLFAPPHPA